MPRRQEPRPQPCDRERGSTWTRRATTCRASCRRRPGQRCSVTRSSPTSRSRDPDARRRHELAAPSESMSLAGLDPLTAPLVRRPAGARRWQRPRRTCPVPSPRPSRRRCLHPCRRRSWRHVPCPSRPEPVAVPAPPVAVPAPAGGRARAGPRPRPPRSHRPRPMSLPARPRSPTPTGEVDDVHLNDLLIEVLERGALRPAPHRRRAARRSGCTASSRRSTEYPVLTPPVIQRMLYAVLTQKQREKFEDEPRARLRLLRARPRPLPRERLPAARRRSAPPSASSRSRSSRSRTSASRRRSANFAGAAARPRARHRPDRLRQVDDARRRWSTSPTARAATTS